ncbi:hypothetical protein IT570_00630 [Candidatus Sumerlaeota bacterium]|nr:hypothetical protein [Candidatus Sumerlaeota bacterium]
MLAQVLKQWFWDCYDHLLALFLANIIFFALVFGSLVLVVQVTMPALPLFSPIVQVHVAAAMAVLFSSVVGALWFSATGYFGSLVEREKYPGFRDLLRGIRADFFLQFKYVGLCATLIAILAINIWFYSFSGLLPASEFLRYTLSGFCFWIILLLLASMIVGLPLRSRERTSVKATLKRSLLMLVRSPLLILGMFFFIMSLWIISAWLRFAPIFLFGFSGTALMINSLYDVMILKQDQGHRMDLERGSATATSWKQRRDLDAEAEQVRMLRSRYERTFRDLLRPWES